MATPTDLQNASAAIQWTNGRGLVTGAQVAGIFAVVISILAGMGTWSSAGFTPNIAAGSIGSTQLAPGAAASNMGSASGNLSGSYPGPLTVASLSSSVILSALGFGPPAHVANAAALAALPPVGESVIRDDVGALYADTGASCAISGGDRGWQVQPASGHCWQTDISRGAPVTLWGGSSNDSTDNQPAMTAGLSAIAAIGGGKLILPATTGCYRINSQVNFQGSNEALSGQEGSAASCIDINFAAGAGIQVGNSTVGSQNNDGVENVTFKHAVARTGGADIEYYAANNSFGKDIICQANYYQCIDVGGSGFGTVLDNISTTGQGQTGICFGCNTQGISANVLVENSSLNYNLRAGIECQRANGNIIRGTDFDFNTHALWADPPSGQQCNVIDASDDYFDLSFQSTVLVDGSQGQVSDWSFHGKIWIASSGENTSQVPGVFTTAPTQIATSPCLQIQGANVINDDFDVHIVNCGGDGINVAAGSALSFSGATTGSVGNGLSIAAGVSHWSWSGRAGGPYELSTAGNGGYGVLVAAGASNYYSVSGDLSGNGKGGLSDGGTGSNKLTSQVLQ